MFTVTASDGEGGTVTLTVTVDGSGSGTITGTDGADWLFGQHGDDTLRGLGARICCAARGATTYSPVGLMPTASREEPVPT